MSGAGEFPDQATHVSTRTVSTRTASGRYQ